MSIRQGKYFKQRGFTLLEVLIAVLVLSIGLIGLAGMQLLGVKNNNSAAMRSQAVFLAQDISDRMRANIGNAGSYVITGTPSCVGLCTITSGCSGSQLATYDVCQWRNSAATLPSGIGHITYDAGNDVYRIRLMWDDERTGATGTNCGSDPTVDLSCFDMEFRP
ncbi:MAG: type IV pilus modification protein PilV [Sedimenticola sp.]|nr:type IV pilus modification protein PilV [Sedimenticola sp.]